jgi:hypothetical protein
VAVSSSQCRCAVYTRQSRESNSDYSSCDAQYDACLHFILAHASQGWIPVDRRYDDEGYSGEREYRPGLNRLKFDINAGLIDRIVVHRLDRLSRKVMHCTARHCLICSASRARMVESNLRRRAIDSIQAMSPSGLPRWADNRTAANSASFRGVLTRSTQLGSRDRGHGDSNGGSGSGFCSHLHSETKKGKQKLLCVNHEFIRSAHRLRDRNVGLKKWIGEMKR